MPIKIVTRADWMAKPPTNIVKLETPVKDVLFIKTDTKDNMTEKEICEWLPLYQLYCMDEENYNDIPFNWLVDFNGTIYEGRGWKADVEKRDLKYKLFKHISIDIGFIGTFKGKNPPRGMERAATKLIELGMRDNIIVSNRHLKVYNWNNFKYDY